MSKGGSVVLAMVMIILKNLFWTSKSRFPFQLQVNVQYLNPFGVQRRVFAYQSRLKLDLTCTQFFCPISTFAMELLTVWMLMMKIRDSARQVTVRKTASSSWLIFLWL